MTFGGLHAITRDGVAAPNSPAAGGSLKTPSRRRKGCATSQAGVIRKAIEGMEAIDEPKIDDDTEPKKENVRTHLMPVYCA